ncbi:MAG TPA: PDZ domain-containing protein [Myxococcota bacterium]|jgi:S1-C subfamily serine protease
MSIVVAFKHSLAPIVAAGLGLSLPFAGVMAWQTARAPIRGSDEHIDVAVLMRGDVPLAPAFHDGKSVGLVVRGATAGSPVSRVGLMNGDIIVAIDGVDVANPAHLLAAFSALSAHHTGTPKHLIVLDILRRGQHGTLSFDLSSLGSF